MIISVASGNMKDILSGHWYVSDTRYGTLVHASLGAGRENSGKLVATVRQQAIVRGKPVVEMGETPAGLEIRKLWGLIVERLQPIARELKEYKDASI